MSDPLRAAVALYRDLRDEAARAAAAGRSDPAQLAALEAAAVAVAEAAAEVEDERTPPRTA